MRILLLAAGVTALLAADLAGQASAERLIAARKAAVDASFRNDQDGLTRAIAVLDGLAGEATLGPRALYWAGWSRWMLAASQIQAGSPGDAMASLERAATDLTRALEGRPDDPEALAILAWALSAQAFIEPARWTELSPKVTANRRRAVELGPDNPRVMIMDAGMTFFTPAQFGGSQERGVERWLEALRRFEAEAVADPVEPDWGRAEAHGWLANLYLTMTPPRHPEARRMADRALELRPDFWYVATQVVPRIED